MIMAIASEEIRRQIMDMVLAGKKNGEILAAFPGQVNKRDLGNMRFNLRHAGKLPEAGRKPQTPSTGKMVKTKMKGLNEFEQRLNAELTALKAKQIKCQTLIGTYGTEKVDFALYLEKQIEGYGKKIALIEELQGM
jgi:hypothetical protein